MAASVLAASLATYRDALGIDCFDVIASRLALAFSHNASGRTKRRFWAHRVSISPGTQLSVFCLDMALNTRQWTAVSQTSCTSDVVVPIDDLAISGSGSGSDPGAVAIASYQVAGASAIVDLTGTNLNGGGWGGPADLIDIGSDPLRRLLRKRVTLECTSGESCYSLKGDPFCVDDSTNAFRLDDGTTGNLSTGDYTLPDGQQGNFNTGPFPTLASSSASASTTFDASSATTTGLSDTYTITDARASTDATSASTRDVSTPTQSAGSTLAAETGASSTTRTSTPRVSASVPNAATSPTTSFQAFVNAAGTPTRFSGFNLVLLAVMGLRAML